MKKRNIKKYFQKRIVDGWRKYLTLNVKYSDIGLTNQYLSRKMLSELLGLEDKGGDTGIVDHYDFYDPSVVVDGVTQLVNVELIWHYLPKNGEDILEYHNLPNNTLYVIDDEKIYFIEGMIGFRNPEYDLTGEKDNTNIPYWLYNEEGNENKPYHYTWVSGDDLIPDSNIIEVLNRFKNNKNFGSDMFSGNFVYGLVSGNFGDKITNNLFNDLSLLSDYCKTNYEDFYDDHINLTYAIRYKDNVKPFLKDLKKIVIKHKVKL